MRVINAFNGSLLVFCRQVKPPLHDVCGGLVDNLPVGRCVLDMGITLGLGGKQDGQSLLGNMPGSFNVIVRFHRQAQRIIQVSLLRILPKVGIGFIRAVGVDHVKQVATISPAVFFCEMVSAGSPTIDAASQLLPLLKSGDRLGGLNLHMDKRLVFQRIFVERGRGIEKATEFVRRRKCQRNALLIKIP